MSEWFPKLKFLGRYVKIELDLSNYATKAVLKNATGLDASRFVDVDLTRSKSEIDKLDIGKLEATPFDLSKLSDAVKTEI